jgi:hypothetical protein
MQSLFANATHKIEYDAARKLVFLRRTAVGLLAVDRNAVLAEAIAALRPLRAQRLLIDLRLAPGNNDPALEQTANHFRRQLSELLPISATVVATAVGRLQISRLSRERGDPGNPKSSIFFNEAEAIAYLMSHPI